VVIGAGEKLLIVAVVTDAGRQSPVPRQLEAMAGEIGGSF